jgi:hypothetical protein
MCQELFPEEVQPEEVITRKCFPAISVARCDVFEFTTLSGPILFQRGRGAVPPRLLLSLRARAPQRHCDPLFFSPPQVANGAQAEGLERWDAALEVSVMCLFVVLMMASFLFCRQPLSPAEWEWQARLPV